MATEPKRNNDNIFFSIVEEENENTSDLDLTKILNEIYNQDFNDISDINDSLIIPQIINYKENYTIKELLLICEYYGIAKEVKSNKFNKDEMIHFLAMYESNPVNSDVVLKRQNLWFYINELKNDKFMKKYVLW